MLRDSEEETSEPILPPPRATAGGVLRCRRISRHLGSGGTTAPDSQSHGYRMVRGSAFDLTYEYDKGRRPQERGSPPLQSLLAAPLAAGDESAGSACRSQANALSPRGQLSAQPVESLRAE